MATKIAPKFSTESVETYSDDASNSADDAINSLFAESAAEQEFDAAQACGDSGMTVDSHQEIIDRIDSTLDLIAEATQVAAGITPLDHFDLSIIIPVYNERESLPQVLARIEQVMPPATQVIVVDDGSTDGTTEWLAEMADSEKIKVISRRRNHGKGSAVRMGIRHTTGRVVAIQDADLEYDPVDLLRAVWPILDGNADVVYGSRYMEHSGDRSAIHRAGNWALTQASNMMTGLRLSDMETCHKAFNGDLLRSIPLKESRFGFEPEITAKISARNVSVMEVPTSYEYRSYSEGKKIGWRDAFAALACMWKYRNG